MFANVDHRGEEGEASEVPEPVEAQELEAVEAQEEVANDNEAAPPESFAESAEGDENEPVETIEEHTNASRQRSLSLQEPCQKERSWWCSATSTRHSRACGSSSHSTCLGRKCAGSPDE